MEIIAVIIGITIFAVAVYFARRRGGKLPKGGSGEGNAPGMPNDDRDKFNP